MEVNALRVLFLSFFFFSFRPSRRVALDIILTIFRYDPAVFEPEGKFNIYSSIQPAKRELFEICRGGGALFDDIRT